MSQFQYVVLGGGNASGYAAREFLNRGVNPGKLCLITQEKVVAYERPALSKNFLFPEKPARLPGFHTCVGMGMDRQDSEFYKDKGITYMTDTTVTSADLSSKVLSTDTGESVSYEKLIIATGARPVRLTDFKVPGADLAGLNYLRDLKDAEALVSSIQEIKSTDGNVVVIGGGYIGMECSAALAMNGIGATMVFPETHLMSRLLNEEAAAFYEAKYLSQGVKLIKGQVATAFEGSDGKVTHVVLKDGTKLPADLVVVGVGARANTDLFTGQLEMEAGGIKVDGQMQTSNSDVYAIGDVAAFPLKMRGGEVQRQEHVTNCRLTAFQAVSAIMAPGEKEDYDYLPFFYSRIFDMSWQFYGFSNKEPVVFGNKSEGKIGMYWVEDGKVVGTMLESGTADENAAIKEVARIQPPAPSAEELTQKGIGFALELVAKV